MASSNGNAAKRQAMTGQWRTPPLPTFAGQHPAPAAPPPGSTMQPPGTVASTVPAPVAMPPIPSNPLDGVALPESTDDYAKALQEAYRRGAEAAARLQQQSHPPPQQPPPQPQPPAPTVPPPHVQQPQHPHPPHPTHPPHPQQHPMQEQTQPQQIQHLPTAVSCPDLQQFQAVPNDPTAIPTLVPNPLAGPVPPPMPPAVHNPPPPPAAVPPAQQPHQHPPHPGQPQVVVPTGAPRSLSLPDMQSYAARAQAEEEKRKKRLARNRASARLRRLRKKNLVDSYEGEVGVLEASLQKLRSHSWGVHSSHEALLEALSMDRGQQVITEAQRTQLIQDILKQQLDQVAFIREAQQEQQILRALVENPDDELARELQGVLQLSEEQKVEISKAAQGLDQEMEAMETLIQCLEAMQSTNWLWNEGVSSIASQFTSIMHPNQLSKFLIWADTNAEALDSLDYCNSPPSQAPPSSAPIFVFGMDDHHHASAATGSHLGDHEH